MPRVIFHIDLDCFFVSVERLFDPTLKNKPVVVAGKSARSVVSSASYEARQFGVRSAMPLVQAKRLCPKLKVVEPQFENYQNLSAKVFEIASSFSPLVEATGLDEGFLDMTGTQKLFGPPHDAALSLQKKVMCDLGLPLSIGIASNKLIAKIATDEGKPHGIFEVKKGCEIPFLDPLSIKKIPGCGKVTQDFLNQKGIWKIADLKKVTPQTLLTWCGKSGHWLWEASQGIGDTDFFVAAKNPVKSRERTFEKDIGQFETLKGQIWSMVCEITHELRQENIFAKSVRIKIRFPDFKTLTRSRVLASPTQDDKVLFAQCLELLQKNWNQDQPMRLLGIAFLLSEPNPQLELFESTADLKEPSKIPHLKDQIQKKFGNRALLTGLDLQYRPLKRK